MAVSRERLDSAVKVLIGSGQLTPEIIMKLGMMNFESHLYVIRLIIENLECLQYPAHSKMLRFLENILEQNDKQKARSDVFKIIAEFDLRQIFIVVKNKISQHDFVVSVKGEYLSQINKHVTAGAANIYREIDRILTANTSLIDDYNSLVAKMNVELAPVAGNGWLGMFGFGQRVRDTSTTEIYNQIVSMLKEGEKILQDFLSLKNVFDQLDVSALSSSRSSSQFEQRQLVLDSISNPELVLSKSTYRPRSYSV